MSKAGKVCAVALLVALAWAVAPVAEAQPEPATEPSQDGEAASTQETTTAETTES